MSVRTQIKLVIIISIHEILLLLLVGYLRQKVRTKPRDLLNRMTEKKCARQKTAKNLKSKTNDHQLEQQKKTSVAMQMCTADMADTRHQTHNELSSGSELKCIHGCVRIVELCGYWKSVCFVLMWQREGVIIAITR